MTAYFTADLFGFLADLKRNNRREWFQANKDRYEAAVKQPIQRFVEDVGVLLRKIAKQFDSGSVFRIHRDTRFAKDKSPYKTHVAAHFSHSAATEMHTPGFYLHLQPGGSIGGGGLWMPEPALLGKVRDRIVSKPAEWKAVVTSTTVEGEGLKRPPAGYDADHQFVNDLKRKSFFVLQEFSDREVCGAKFMDRYLDACRSAAPLVRFTSKAVGLGWS